MNLHSTAPMYAFGNVAATTADDVTRNSAADSSDIVGSGAGVSGFGSFMGTVVDAVHDGGDRQIGNEFGITTQDSLENVNGRHTKKHRHKHKERGRTNEKKNKPKAEKERSSTSKSARERNSSGGKRRKHKYSESDSNSDAQEGHTAERSRKRTRQDQGKERYTRDWHEERGNIRRSQLRDEEYKTDKRRDSVDRSREGRSKDRQRGVNSHSDCKPSRSSDGNDGNATHKKVRTRDCKSSERRGTSGRYESTYSRGYRRSTSRTYSPQAFKTGSSSDSSHKSHKRKSTHIPRTDEGDKDKHKLKSGMHIDDLNRRENLVEGRLGSTGNGGYFAGFKTDKRHDKDNLTYGTPYLKDVPKFHRQREATVIGTDSLGTSGFFLARERERKKTARYFDDRVGSSAVPTDIPLAPPRISVEDNKELRKSPHEAAEFLPLSSTTSATGSNTRDARRLLYGRLLRENPSNTSTWLSLVALQAEALQGKHTKVLRKIVREKQLAILEKAVYANQSNEVLRLHYLRLSSELAETSELAKLWREAMAMFSASPALWNGYLLMRTTHFASYKFRQITSTFDRCLRTLTSYNERNSALHSQGAVQARTLRASTSSGELLSDPDLVRLMSQYFRVIWDAGHTELAIGWLQAVVEYNTFGQPSDAHSGVHVRSREFFEPFWDSEVPRFGERHTKGWRAHAVGDTRPYPIREGVEASGKANEYTSGELSSRDLEGSISTRGTGDTLDHLKRARASEREQWLWMELYRGIGEALPWHLGCGESGASVCEDFGISPVLLLRSPGNGACARMNTEETDSVEDADRMVLGEDVVESLVDIRCKADVLSMIKNALRSMGTPMPDSDASSWTQYDCVRQWCDVSSLLSPLAVDVAALHRATDATQDYLETEHVNEYSKTAQEYHTPTHGHSHPGDTDVSSVSMGGNEIELDSRTPGDRVGVASVGVPGREPWYASEDYFKTSQAVAHPTLMHTMRLDTEVNRIRPRCCDRVGLERAIGGQGQFYTPLPGYRDILRYRSTLGTSDPCIERLYKFCGRVIEQALMLFPDDEELLLGSVAWVVHGPDGALAIEDGIEKCKTLLSCARYGENYRLWYTYCQLELQLGNRKAARKAYARILSMRRQADIQQSAESVINPGQHSHPIGATLPSWDMWLILKGMTQLGLVQGEFYSVLHALVAFVKQPNANEKPIKKGALPMLSTTELMVAKRTYANIYSQLVFLSPDKALRWASTTARTPATETEDAVPPVHHPVGGSAMVHFIDCYALFEYLSPMYTPGDHTPVRSQPIPGVSGGEAAMRRLPSLDAAQSVYTEALQWMLGKGVYNQAMAKSQTLGALKRPKNMPVDVNGTGADEHEWTFVEPSSAVVETLLTGYVEMMVRHAQAHASPLNKSRQVLETALLLFPGNTYFLSQYILAEARQGLMTRRRQFMDNLLCLYFTVDLPITTWLFALQAEMVMRNPVHSRVISLLERAVANEYAISAPVIWHVYLRIALKKRLDTPTYFLSLSSGMGVAKGEKEGVDPEKRNKHTITATDGENATADVDASPKQSHERPTGETRTSGIREHEQLVTSNRAQARNGLLDNRACRSCSTENAEQKAIAANNKTVEEVFYRALEACPGTKSLYIHAVSNFSDNAEAWRIAVDLMQEKELRVRTPLEELELL
ncbi:hypothetical protein SARC_08595 [Sphaeroforma arctica JP610]|uniref:Uncharacterized protein n=1 Tax=Sphaeroforma arctica JP610 TaxID=667725 RepID=A0A0L0FQK8_9EUKA|nr:hypothetical protein SARC_08595 [Sphaeroforma arctica JP610]KNC78994.1 hypothetical protein SARC_08595 [Sphaeroforma arctica JP610]|eukprot:XP_014152896.1 hypothetical protein SARC_08595 [Sphaeroforma arctica JP610]